MRNDRVPSRPLPVSPAPRKRLIGLGAMLAAGATAGTAQAATITVDSLSDTTATDSQCTLREAILNANADADTTGGDCVAGSGTDTIGFQTGLSGLITLSGTQLAITDSVNVDGPGASSLSVSGNSASRIFYIFNNTQTLDVTISGLTLTQAAATSGSAVYSRGENVTLSSVTLTANVGDAVNAVEAGSLTVQSSTITGTTTGRGIRTDHINSVSVTGSTVSQNSSVGKGAGIFLYRIGPGVVTIDDSIITGNATGSRGGGVFLYNISGTITIRDSEITGNTAGNRGGGMDLYKPLSDVTIENTTISGNTSANRGGGIFFYKQNAGLTMTIRNTTISGNSAGATFGGGGIFFYKQSGTTILENTTISGNTANRGGGIYDYNVLTTPSLVIRNSTIQGNQATDAGGNVRMTHFPNVSIVNSIIANGSAPTAPDLQTGPSNVTVNYSLLEDTTGATFTGANNLTGVDPQLAPLADNGGPTLTHLPATTSPVLNAGDPAFTPPPATDQRGQTRVVGGRVDIGSVELDGGTIQLSSATYSVNEGAGTATITITRTGNTDPASVTYTTSDGSAAAPGDYTSTSGTATFAAGTTSTTFDVPIFDDAMFEGNETFNVAISDPSGNATLGSPSAAVVTIVDNDLPVADLSISKTTTATAVFVGDPVTYTITVNNAGPNTASSVVVTDIIPAGSTFVAATPSQGSCSGATTVTCTLGAIANGNSATITLTLTPTTAGPLSNTATVSDSSSTDPDPTDGDSTATVSVGAALAAVPLFSDVAKIIFAITSALMGLFVIRRRS